MRSTCNTTFVVAYKHTVAVEGVSLDVVGSLSRSLAAQVADVQIVE